MPKHEPTEIALIYDKQYGEIQGLETHDIALGNLPARETWDWVSIFATKVYRPGPAWPHWERPPAATEPPAADLAAKEQP